MIKRKRIFALLLTAVCLLGILPLSVSAYTPIIRDVTYTLNDTNFDVSINNEPVMTPIDGILNYFVCDSSPLIDGTVSIDVFRSDITEIGYQTSLDGDFVIMNVILTASAYIPDLSPIPMYINKQPGIMIFGKNAEDPLTLVGFETDGGAILAYVSSDYTVDIVIRDILPTTNREILNDTLQAFTADLSNLNTQNYVDWILGGYSSITDVFVNNAKIQYVMDNPIIVIALVVFALAIAFAIATYIFKIFRRY